MYHHVSVLWSTALVAMSHVFFAKKNRYHPSGSSGVLQKQW
jgi:hypothetical protein